MKSPSVAALCFGLVLAAFLGAVALLSPSSNDASAVTSHDHQQPIEHRYLQSKTKCGCESCTMDIWKMQAPYGAGNDFTCGARIKELKKTTYTMQACRMVGSNFPDECGACNPDTCDDTSTTDTLPPSSTTFTEMAAQATSTTVISLPTVTYMGNNGRGGVFPLEKCQGDCDSDAECMPGLICYQRNAGEPIPGCSGNDDLGYDYCILPPSTPAPTVPAPDYFEEEGTPAEQQATFQAYSSSSSSSDGGVADDYYTNDDTVDDTNTNNDDNGEFTVSDPFVLKMYWQEGYRWQEETFERKWCMRCDSSRQECSPGRGVYITSCDNDMTTNWEFLDRPDGSFSLRMTEADLCLQANGYARVTVEPCDLSNGGQNFRAANGQAEFGNRFELRSQSYPNDCVTQQHHPRQGEFLFLYPCSLPESDTTNFWNMY